MPTCIEKPVKILHLSGIMAQIHEIAGTDVIRAWSLLVGHLLNDVFIHAVVVG